MSIKSKAAKAAKVTANVVSDVAIIGASTAVGGTVAAYGIYANPLNVDEQTNIYASAGAGAATAVVADRLLMKAKSGVVDFFNRRAVKRLQKKLEKESHEVLNELLGDD